MSRSSLSEVRPQQALQSYLDALLQDAFADIEGAELDEFEQAVQEERLRDAQARPLRPVPAVSPAAAAAPAQRAVLELEPRPAPLLNTLRVAVEAPVQVIVPEPVDEPPAAPAVMPPETPEPAPLPEWQARPEWSEQPFECLLFDVAGLTLAVPLVSLGSIYSFQAEELTPLFGQPDWFLGLMPSQAGNLRVLDTARWVLAERYREEFREELQYVISVQGYEWGLAVHQVSRSIRLDPSEVKWRGERSQRPWLAGTVIEHMCALLDVRALAELIASGAQRA